MKSKIVGPYKIHPLTKVVVGYLDDFKHGHTPIVRVPRFSSELEKVFDQMVIDVAMKLNASEGLTIPQSEIYLPLNEGYSVVYRREKLEELIPGVHKPITDQGYECTMLYLGPDERVVACDCCYCNGIVVASPSQFGFEGLWNQRVVCPRCKVVVDWSFTHSG